MDDSSNSNERGLPTDAQELVDYARRQADCSALTCEQAAAPGPLPDSIPGYDLLKEIHRGGQGVVYEAKQQSTRRKVAIKVLREGPFAGRIEQARFERETEILVRLKHPNIVAVLDAGVTAEHRYLVMEFVEGTALDEYLVGGLSNSGSRDRTALLLRLFLKICEALNAAHLRGVVHRDLKPSNIRIDAQGEPHVLDFGLGRLLGDEESSSSDGRSLTITGQFVGSLPWASPEQAEGVSDKIDIRTDVYGLGLILFFMLTRRFPYEVVGPMQTILETIQRAVAVRPSSFHEEIDDDLDTMVLRCLSKERERRYQSAGELGRDVERYLDGEPIEAKRDSTWYVLRKTVNRHRGVFVAGIALVFLLGVGLVVTSTLYIRSVSAERNAKRRLEQAQQLAHAFIFDLDEKLQKGPMSAREFYVKTAFEYLNHLAGEGLSDPRLLEDIVAAYIKIGDVQGNATYANRGDAKAAMATFETAFSIAKEAMNRRPDDRGLERQLATVYERIGDMQTYMSGSHSEAALETFRLCLEIRERIARKSPDELLSIRELASVLNRIGNAELEMGRFDEALATYERNLAMRKLLSEREPENLEARLSLALGYRRIGNAYAALERQLDALSYLETAISIVDEAAAAGSETNDLKETRLLLSNKIAETQLAIGNPSAARGRAQVSVRTAEELSIADPDNVQAAVNQWYANHYLGMAYEDLGRLSEALVQFHKGVEVASELLERRPGQKSGRHILAHAYESLGRVKWEAGDFEEALINFRRCVEIRDALVGEDPASAHVQEALAASCKSLADLLKTMGNEGCEAEGAHSSRRREAKAYYVRSLEIIQALATQGTLSPRFVAWPETLTAEVREADRAMASSGE
ncbi:MAG: serine/threonine protein kinase [Planctomycetes bacterium]|nr:serine/threonine protein kinase [Planctomycetota bacterium]MBI3833399.1 serine/threonine protein kinase [Planctomycetota bacterium]